MLKPLKSDAPFGAQPSSARSTFLTSGSYEPGRGVCFPNAVGEAP